MNKATAVIRDRYQLTIPEQIRQYLTWIAPQRAVQIVSFNNKFIMEPYSQEEVDWQKIWQSLKTVKKQGKKISLAKFITKDRESH